ncbi:thioesterase family protein [Novosphingobium bradum]|uniref:Thioesterase family protein n=1 Tax=Novosphingobium bradum TaxID=1737444 RepID=A0ABV7IQ70_9SPHN
MSERPSAFYSRDGERFVPTGLGVSPWNPKAQLGVALAGLVGQTIDAVPTITPMITARLTIDILGAIPLEPLTTEVRVLREGKRMQTLEVRLLTGDKPVVHATTLRLRQGSSPEAPPPLAHSLPGAGADVDPQPWFDSVRLVGDYHTPGPGSTWTRFTAEVIAGEPLSPMARMAMIADYSAGTAPLLPLREWTLANLDIAVYMTREPVGDWLLVEAESEGTGTGIGISRGRIGDERGMFGTSLQTVFLDRR